MTGMTASSPLSSTRVALPSAGALAPNPTHCPKTVGACACAACGHATWTNCRLRVTARARTRARACSHAAGPANMSAAHGGGVGAYRQNGRRLAWGVRRRERAAVPGLGGLRAARRRDAPAGPAGGSTRPPHRSHRTKQRRGGPAHHPADPVLG